MRKALAPVLLLVVAFATPADERTVDRQRDASRPASRGGDTAGVEPGTSPYFRRIATQRRSPERRATESARHGLSVAAKQAREAALLTLNRILRMELPDSAETDELLNETYRRLGDLSAGSSARQLQYYALSLRYAADTQPRRQLEARIDELGGDLFALTFRSESAGSATRDAGPDDLCSGATPIVLDHSEVMSITPVGDHNWRAFDVPGPDGRLVRIETITDTPGTFADDTDLALWGGCDPDGAGTALVEFDDDGGLNFMSLIETPCLDPGSYYIEVGGFFDMLTPDDFTLDVSIVGTCEIPEPDAYEPDDQRGGQNPIGFPTATSPRGNGWGRSKREIQGHSIEPVGDVDLTELTLTQDSFVRVATRAQFPTFFNGFEGSGPEQNLDTRIDIEFQDDPFYGGYCNEPNLGFPNFCRSDDECPDLVNPWPGFPPCIELCDILITGIPDICGPTLASTERQSLVFPRRELAICLPRNGEGSTSASANGPWIIETAARNGDARFSYEIQVRNEVACRFEREPNNGPTGSPPATVLPAGVDEITLGESVHGFFDFSETSPFQDRDWYAFEVPEGRESRITLRTDGYDLFEVDTGIELIVGPADGACSDGGAPCAYDTDCVGAATCDDNAEYFLVASDDDSGAGFLSRLDLVVPPPSEFLGNVAADAHYFVNVTSFFLNPNFPYELKTDLDRAPAEHVESDDDCSGEGAANPVTVGAEFLGEIGAACDFDAYKLTLSESTFVKMRTTGGADPAMQLVDCASTSVLACDDDGGEGLDSLLEGCLPPGEYCVRIRASTAGDSFDYGLRIDGTPGCLPDVIPQIFGDGAFACRNFDPCH